ncbi:MAG: DUF5696 domain-containing protein [Bacilli bacterium]|nr:DUF5696 domain-containing protein [Bacilli bacterium]
MKNIENRKFRFPWKKLLILGVFAAIILTIYLIVVLNQVNVPPRQAYDKTNFVHSSDYLITNGETTVIENSNYKFELNNKNTTFIVLDKTTNEEWRSNPDASNRFLDTLIVYYGGFLGAAIPLGSFKDAVDYDDFWIRKTENSLEILYEIGGKKEVDASDFAEIMTDERMNEAILSKLEEGSWSYRRVTEQAYVAGELNGVKTWKLKDGIQTSVLETLYEIFYTECGYTIEDLEYDLSLNNILYEDIYGYIEIAIKYTLTDDGFEIDIINDSIYEKEKFPLLYVDVLPYFGCATTSDDGYFMVPDGSGVLIDFNTDRSFALPYSQRVYGKDLAVFRDVMENETEMLSLPLYGLKRNDYGFIAIAEEGAEMAVINAAISTVSTPYNRAYYRYIFRETDVFSFEAINSSTKIVEATKWYSTNDFKIKIKFVYEDEASYSAMAKVYQEYLVETGVLSKKDQTNSVALNLTLLGGYVVRENFIGFPYNTVKSLTNTKEAEMIIGKLVDDGLTNINLIYRGWSNDGLKPKYMGKVKFNSATGRLKDFKNLQEYLNEVNVNFFPEVNINTAYTSRKINKNNDAVKDVFGDTVVNYDYLEPIYLSDFDTTEYYTLKSSTYEQTFNNLSKTLLKLGTSNLAFNDFGNQIYGSYDKKDNYFRTDTLNDFIRVIEQNQNNYEQLLFKNPSLYALKYASSAIDIPTTGTDYQIVGTSIPFYQLVLSGYLDYSGKSFNTDDKRRFEWHALKAIETLSNINLTWSYTSTTALIDTEYSYYYSTYYGNWYDKVISLYQELNDLGIYNSSLLKHDLLIQDGSVTKSTYVNGLEIVFNYGVSTYTYHGLPIAPNEYRVVKEAQ